MDAGFHSSRVPASHAVRSEAYRRVTSITPHTASTVASQDTTSPATVYPNTGDSARVARG